MKFLSKFDDLRQVRIQHDVNNALSRKTVKKIVNIRILRYFLKTIWILNNNPLWLSHAFIFIDDSFFQEVKVKAVRWDDCFFRHLRQYNNFYLTRVADCTFISWMKCFIYIPTKQNVRQDSGLLCQLLSVLFAAGCHLQKWSGPRELHQKHGVGTRCVPLVHCFRWSLQSGREKHAFCHRRGVQLDPVMLKRLWSFVAMRNYYVHRYDQVDVERGFSAQTQSHGDTVCSNYHWWTNRMKGNSEVWKSARFTHNINYVSLGDKFSFYFPSSFFLSRRFLC